MPWKRTASARNKRQLFTKSSGVDTLSVGDFFYDLQQPGAMVIRSSLSIFAGIVKPYAKQYGNKRYFPHGKLDRPTLTFGSHVDAIAADQWFYYSAQCSIDAVAVLLAQSVVVQGASASILAEATLTASASIVGAIIQGAATISAVCSLNLFAVDVQYILSLLSASSIVQAQAISLVLAIGQVSSVCSIQVQSLVVGQSSSSVSATGLLSASSLRVDGGNGSISAASTLVANSGRVELAASSILGAATVSASGLINNPASLVISSSLAVNSSCLIVDHGSSGLAAALSLNLSPVVSYGANSLIQAELDLTLSPIQIIAATGSIQSSASVYSDATYISPVSYGSSLIQPSLLVSSTSLVVQRAESSVFGTSLVSADALVKSSGEALIGATSLVQAVAVYIQPQITGEGFAKIVVATADKLDVVSFGGESRDGWIEFAGKATMVRSKSRAIIRATRGRARIEL